MPMMVAPLNASNADELRAWHDCHHASHMFGREIGAPWMLEEMRAQLLGDSPGEKTLGYSGTVDGVVVGAAWVVLRVKDNLHLAWTELHTRPDHRNRGHGSVMLEHLTEVAREHGRRTIRVGANFPCDGPADGAGRPSVEFLLHWGFTLGIGDVLRVMDLPADGAVLQRLVQEAEPHHQDYVMRQFVGPVPDDIIDSFGELVCSLITEAPMGDLELEPEVLDAERTRADENVFEESGRTKYPTVAVGRTGRSRRTPSWSSPSTTRAGSTSVGRWLAATTADTGSAWPRRPATCSGSRVNERMGFRPVERLGEFQKKLG